MAPKVWADVAFYLGLQWSEEWVCCAGQVVQQDDRFVGRVIEEKLKLFDSRVKTLTVDNGKEFVNHQANDRTLRSRRNLLSPITAGSVAARQQRELQRLLRQYIHKNRRMETVTDKELTMIQNRMNHRPRRLGFKTPHKVFHASLNRVAPRT